MRELSRVALFAILAVVIGVCGCGGRGSADKPTVAFITNNPHSFWNFANRGTDKAAKEFNVNVDFRRPPNGTLEEQRAIVEDLLSKGIAGIAISPNDAANQAAFLNRVAEQVPLIAQDNDLPPGSKRLCYIGTDNYEAGRSAGKLVREALPDGGRIVIYVGRLDAPNAVDRRRGILDELAGTQDATGPKYGSYELIDTMTDDGDASKAKANAEDTLVKYGSEPEKLCLVGLWEYNPPAILSAAKGANLEGIKVVAFDENEGTLDGIRAGLIRGTVVQNPFEFGYQAVRVLAALVRGDRSVLPEDGLMLIPHRVITADNVDAFAEEVRRLKGPSH